uniref:Glucosamine-6-phosphate deaminase n=1 Tax=Glossina palpalis gambiensis TaxID=67801 RepID=A0A1B0B4T5_9MUSC
MDSIDKRFRYIYIATIGNDEDVVKLNIYSQYEKTTKLNLIRFSLTFRNIYILDGNTSDPMAECNEYKQKIKNAGGIELFIGGIGPDGHIAFNEPGSSLVSRKQVKRLAHDTLEANARFFDNDMTKVPKPSLTVDVATVMDSKEIMILITGAHNSETFRFQI